MYANAVFVAPLITCVLSYLVMYRYVQNGVARRPGESEEVWLSRQRDPSTAGVLAVLLGWLGAAIVFSRMHRAPRAIAMTAAYIAGTAVSNYVIALCISLVFDALQRPFHPTYALVDLAVALTHRH